MTKEIFTAVCLFTIALIMCCYVNELSNCAGNVLELMISNLPK